MPARTIAIALLVFIGASSAPLRAQGQTCTQGIVWGASGGICNGDSQGFDEMIAEAQATYGGAGPSCSYTPNPYNPSCTYAQCTSVGWTCKPSSPPVSGPSCPDCGEPISLANGNVFIQETDVRIPGLGGGLTLTRNWNSTWPCYFVCFPQANMFGTDWRSTYEESLSVGSNGTMTYSRADGSIWSFAFYGSPGIFHLIAPSNVPLVTLTEQGTTSPTWTVTFQNGEQRVFNGLYGGPLSAIIDRNGNTTTLAYTNVGTTDFPMNILTTVTDPAGRHLYFNYASPTGSQLVSSVTSDPGTGINVTYTYAEIDSWFLRSAFGPRPILTQVTQSDNTTVNFSYDFDLNITSVTDTNGKVLESHQYVSYVCNAGATSARADGVDALTVSFPNADSYCSFGGVGYPSLAAP